MSRPTALRLRLGRMTAPDFSEILRPCNRRGGDLTTAPIPLAWPVVEGDPHAADEALRRLQYSTQQQKKFFDTDPTCHSLKVVTSGGEIVAIARWNFYPHGYSFEEHHVVRVPEFVPEGALAPFGKFCIDFYHDLMNGMMQLRRSWMQQGPCWILMALVTRECYRKQGAASLIIRWGMEQARKDGIPAYLEASVLGKPVYEEHGFRQVGDLVPWDLRPYGKDMVFSLATMASTPNSPHVVEPTNASD